MTPIELFVENLGRSIPKNDKDFIGNLHSNISFHDIEDFEYRKNEIMGTYFPKKKKKEIIEFHDLILDFIFNYEIDQFDMFSVNFYTANEVASNKDYIFVGSYEGAELVIDKKSNSILLLDVDGTKICKCASDGKEFLYSLLYLNTFMQEDRSLNQKKDFIYKHLNIINKEQYKFWLTLIQNF